MPSTNQLISTIRAYLPVAVAKPCGGILSDFLRKKKVMRDTNLKKFSKTVGFSGKAVCW